MLPRLTAPPSRLFTPHPVIHHTAATTLTAVDIVYYSANKKDKKVSVERRLTHVRAEGEQRLIGVLAAQRRRMMTVLTLRRLQHRRLAVTGDL